MEELNPNFQMDLYLQEIAVFFDYPVVFTRDAFNPRNDALLKVIRRKEADRRHRFLIYLDRGVTEKTPNLLQKVETYAKEHRRYLELAASPRIVPGGEQVKNRWEVVKGIMEDIGNNHLCRQSFVIAVGGGSVLDMVGFATSVVHRGLRLIRLPTTVLAQNDAGVGVKNGMNEHGMKNYVGTFWPPFGVINDFDFLKTLNQKHWVGGIAEAFKVAIIKDAGFFEFLFGHAKELRERSSEPMEELIRRCAALHLDHIRSCGDPFEMGSSKPLDFGHWSSHRLEALSGFKIGHGQAVAVGIALDSVYAHNVGLLGEDELERILQGLKESGLPVFSPLLERRESSGRLSVLKGLDDFKEHLGGELSITLPRSIGEKCDVHEMDESLVERCVSFLKDRFGSEAYQEC